MEKRTVIWLTTILVNIANRNCDVNDLDDLKEIYHEIKNNYEQPLTVGVFDYVRSERLTREDQVTLLIKNSIETIKCYLTYYMLLYMHARHPENRANAYDVVNTSIENACPSLAQQMLVTRMDTDYYKEEHFSRFTWIFNLHTQKMEQLASLPDDDDERMSRIKRLYDNGLEYVRGEMPEMCTIDNYTLSKNDIFNDLFETDRSVAVNKLTGLCGREKISEYRLRKVDFDRLCLNNLIEDPVKMATLTKSFGFLKNDDRIVGALSALMKSVKNPTATLCVMVNALKSVHVHFIQMLKTIMLRGFQTFVSHLVSLDLFRQRKHACRFHCELTNFTEFLGLTYQDDFVILVNRFVKWDQRWSCFALRKSTKLATICDSVDRLLQTYDNYDYTKIITGDEKIKSSGNNDSESPEFDDSGNNHDDGGTDDFETIENYMEKIENESTKATETKILVAIECAKKLVDYLKHTLNGVSIRVIRNFTFETFPEGLKCFS